MRIREGMYVKCVSEQSINEKNKKFSKGKFKIGEIGIIRSINVGTPLSVLIVQEGWRGKFKKAIVVRLLDNNTYLGRKDLNTSFEIVE